MVTVGDVRTLALTLPRTTEHLIHDRVKFRVKQIVYCAFSRDEALMGFGFPKEEREALVASEPHKYVMPGQSDLRYNWVAVRLSELGQEEMEDRVFEAWTMCVPKFLVAEQVLRLSDQERARRTPPPSTASPTRPRSGPRGSSAR